MNGWRKSSHSFSNGNCAEVAAWRTSTASISNGECAEVRQDGTVVLVRDTKDRGGPVLAFGAGTWAAFVARLRSA
jgi:Domain of unknown function (DUF397)